MRRDILGDSCGRRIAFQYFPEPLTAHRAAGAIRKQILAFPSLQQTRPRRIHKSMYAVLRLRRQGNSSFLPVLSAGQISHLKIQIFYPQIYQLAHPDSCGIQDQQHRLITYSLIRLGIRLLQKLLNFLHSQYFRNLFFHLRTLQRYRRVILYPVHAEQILIKGTKRSNISGNRGRRHMVSFQVQKIGIQVRLCGFGNIRHILFFKIFLCLFQISFIGNLGIMRNLPEIV